MSPRNFRHRFSAPGAPPSFSDLTIDTDQIAAAAMRELTQLSLRSSPFSLLLDELLDPTVDWFTWKEKLGLVRETRTALSGLMARFIARAYLETQHYTFFDPIRADDQTIPFGVNLAIRRARDNNGDEVKGDLPDWVIGKRSHGRSIAIAESKGSYDRAGPWPALSKAIPQTQRVEVVRGNTRIRVKTWAIATRWAVAGDFNLDAPWLAVHDPTVGDRAPDEIESTRLLRGSALGHFESLVAGMGLERTAEALRRARAAPSGHLELPRDELMLVETGDQKVMGFAMIVTPFGFFPLTPDRPPELIANAAMDLADGRAGLLLVDADTLYDADNVWRPVRRPLHREAQRYAFVRARVPPGVADGAAFWSRRHGAADGSEFLPLKTVTIRRPF